MTPRVTILPKIETRHTNASPTWWNSMALGSVGILVAMTTSSAFALGRVSGERKIKKKGGGAHLAIPSMATWWASSTTSSMTSTMASTTIAWAQAPTRVLKM